MLPLQLPGVDAERIADIDSTMKAKFSSNLNMILHQTPEERWRTIGSYALEFLWKIVLALAIFYAGRWLIRRLKRFMNNIFVHRHVDSSLSIFLIDMVGIILYSLLALAVIEVLGLNSSGFIAIFLSAGLAIGLALSGTLQNFAGGVMVLLQKPFHIGDYIDTQGYGGTVKAIRLFNTVITTPDNQTVLIPNGPISTGIVKNYSKEALRRVDWIFGVAYGDDFGHARTVLAAIFAGDERILKAPVPLIEINELAASSVRIAAQAWVAAADYWDVFFEVNRLVYVQFPQNGIGFTSNQMDVHITRDEAVAKG